MDTHSLLYATDLADAEWALLQPLLPAEAPTGRPCIHARRTILNAIFSVLRTGCAWRFLPQEWPTWQTVYGYFRCWRRDGPWERIHRTLRQQLRLQLQRDPQPSAGSVDSQSVKTTNVGGVRGYDGAKKLVGRNRHILVDTEGLAHAVNVPPASIMDRDGIKLVLLVLDEATRAQLPRMRLLWLDADYNGRRKGKDWVEQTTGWRVETVKAIHRFKRYWVPNEPPAGPDRLVELLT